MLYNPDGKGDFLLGSSGGAEHNKGVDCRWWI